MNNVYLEYIQELAQLNAHLVTPGQMPESKVFNAFAWGLVEEYEEFWNAYGEEAELKESGDVLAYVTLLLLCTYTVEETAEKLEGANREACFNKLAYFSNIKRVNREGEPIRYELIIDSLGDLLRFMYEIHSITFAEIAEANISKLKDRASRGVMFKGSGNDR